MPLSPKLFWQSAGKPKLQKIPRKKPCIENKVEYNLSVDVECLNKSLIRTESSQD